MLEGLFEIQMLGHPYIAGLDSNFTKTEAKEFIMKIKKKGTGYDGIPAKFWKVFCIRNDGIETLTNIFNKIKKGKEFTLNWQNCYYIPNL
jgi:hypothetical protein